MIDEDDDELNHLTDKQEGGAEDLQRFSKMMMKMAKPTMMYLDLTPNGENIVAAPYI